MLLPDSRFSYRAESGKHQREPLDSGPLFRIFPWLFPRHCRQISRQEAALCNVSSTFFILDQLARPEVIREFDSFLFLSYKYFLFVQLSLPLPFLLFPCSVSHCTVVSYAGATRPA